MNLPRIRHATRRLFVLLFVSALTACGGGGAEDSASQGVAPAAQPNGTVTLVAGTLDLGSAEDLERFARIGAGIGIAADGDGNLFYPAGGTVVRRSAAGDVAPVTAATLLEPLGVAVDGGGTVFVTQKGEQLFGPSYQVSVLRIDRQGQVTTVSSRLSVVSPVAIAAGADGSYYVSATGTLRRVLPDGTVVDVTAPEVRRTIDSIAVDAGGNVYFGHDNMIKKIAPGKAEVLLAGASTEGSANGTGDQARFRFGGDKNFLNPRFQTSLAVDSVGNVYVADNGNHTIRRISAAGVVTTVAGQAGVSGLTTGPLPGKLFAPTGLALHGDKSLYVVSAGAVLKIELP